jgi:tRNA(Ile)-lysidine synthase
VIKLLRPTPNNSVLVAVSGGPDSMALLDFLSRKKQVIAFHHNHGADSCNYLQDLVESYCNDRKITLHCSKNQSSKKSSESWYEYWRNERYSAFSALRTQYDMAYVHTAHNLDDQVETWIMSSFSGGNPKLMPTVNHSMGISRPVLSTPKIELISWCDRKGVPYFEEPTNFDSSGLRSKVRMQLIDQVLEVFPNLKSTIKHKMNNVEFLSMEES